MRLFAIPNGGFRARTTGVMLKHEGVVAGVADLFWAKANRSHHGLFIEMKVKPNRQTQTQKDFQKEVTEAGYRYEVVYTFDRFQELIDEYEN